MYRKDFHADDTHDDDYWQAYSSVGSIAALSGEKIPVSTESESDQFRCSGTTYTGGYSHTLTEMYGDCPVSSIPFSLPPREWTMEELKQKLRDVVGIDCSGHTRITFTGESDGLFQVETCHFDEGQHFELWSVNQFRLYLGCEAMKYDKNLLGDVLANYEYNGICGVDMYLYDLDPQSGNNSVWPEGSESLAANSPSGNIASDATSKDGESSE